MRTMEKWGMVWAEVRFQTLLVSMWNVIKYKPTLKITPQEKTSSWTSKNVTVYHWKNTRLLSMPEEIDLFTINKYFDLLDKIISNHSLGKKPEQIYNLDETTFCNNPSKTKFPQVEQLLVQEKEIELFCLEPMQQEKSSSYLLYLQAKTCGTSVWPRKMKDIRIHLVQQQGARWSLMFLRVIWNTHLSQMLQKSDKFYLYNEHCCKWHLHFKITASLQPHFLPLDLSCFKSLKIWWDAELVKW